MPTLTRKALYKLSEVSAITGLSYYSLRWMVRHGDLEHKQNGKGRHYLISAETLRKTFPVEWEEFMYRVMSEKESV